MSAVAHNTAMRSAQLSHDNASPDDCDDLAEQIHSEYLTDADKCAEADANWSGTLDGSQYGDIETALADLHSVDPSDLLGSDVLARVYRLAKVCAAARDEALSEMADEEAAKQRDAAEDMRADYADMPRWVA